MAIFCGARNLTRHVVVTESTESTESTAKSEYIRLTQGQMELNVSYGHHSFKHGFLLRLFYLCSEKKEKWPQKGKIAIQRNSSHKSLESEMIIPNDDLDNTE